MAPKIEIPKNDDGEAYPYDEVDDGQIGPSFLDDPEWQQRST